MKFKKLLLSIVALGFVATTAHSADFMTLPHTFAARQLINSSKIMANYNALRNSIIDGSKKIFVSQLVVGDQAQFSNGTVSLPEITFTSDADTGLYRIGANDLGVTAGGVNTASFTATQLSVISGAVTTPGLTIIGDVDTGIYRIAADNLGITAGGSNVLDMTAAVTTINAKVIIPDDVLLVANGSVSAPSIGFATDPDSGLYRIGTNSIGIAAEGVNVITVTTPSVTIASPLIVDLTAGITASTTQTQGQQALTSDISEISTVANDDDTVTLPSAAAGRTATVINNGANILQIFPASGDDLGKGANTAIKMATGSTFFFKAYDATNWQLVNKFSEIAHTIHLDTGAGHGSGSTKVRRIETSITNTGTAITVTQSSTLGTVFTIHEDGFYSMAYTDTRTAAAAVTGISLNASGLTDSVQNLATAEILALSSNGAANERVTVSVTAYLLAGSIIRPQTNGTQDTTGDDQTRFYITKVH